MREERLSKYLHLPIQILWFDTNEVALIVIFYLLAVIFGGVMYLALIILPPILIKEKRKLARGYFQHTMFELGWLEFKGYPNPSAKVFHE